MSDFQFPDYQRVWVTEEKAMEKTEQNGNKKWWQRAWQHLTKMKGDETLSRVSWVVRAWMVLAAVLVTEALFLLPTAEAVRHHIAVWILTSAMAMLCVLCGGQWHRRPLRSKSQTYSVGRAVWYEVWGYGPRSVIFAWRWWLVVSVLVIAVMVGFGLTQPTTVMEWEAKKISEAEEQERGWRRDRMEAEERSRFARICAKTPDQEACTATPAGWYRVNTAKVEEFLWGVSAVIAIGIGVFGLIWLIRLPQRREIAIFHEKLDGRRVAYQRMERRAQHAEKKAEEQQKAAEEAGTVVVAVIAELYAGRGATRQELGRVAHACRLRLRDVVLPVLVPDTDQRDALMERARRERDPDERADGAASATPSVAEESA